MPLSVISISGKLTEAGLKVPSFSALIPDAQTFGVLFFQPRASIVAGKSGVRNSDAAFASAQHLAFWKLASEIGVGLAATPEYSCPLACIEQLLREGTSPPEGALWTIGCESASSAEMREFVEHLSTDHHVHVIVDIPNDATKFLDPVCILFSTKNAEDKSITVCVIQFKTYPMADAARIELDHLALGNTIYVIEGPGRSIRFAVLLCSDTLSIQNLADHTLLYPNSLVLHLQMNPNPRHVTFKRYRETCFDLATKTTELLCLNWAKGIQFNGQPPSQDQCLSGSAVYLSADKLNTNDERINSNHALGLYLTRWDSARAYAYYFHSDPLVFHFRTTKASQDNAPAVQARRSGPEMRGVYAWDAESVRWRPQQLLDDGASTAFSQHHGTQATLARYAANPVNLERLIILSCGKCLGEAWERVENLSSFRIDASEVLKRITFAQDSSAEAVAFRRDILSHFSSFLGIVGNSDNYPPQISSLKNASFVSYDPARPHRNLYADGGGQEATVVYAGQNRSDEELSEMFSRIESILAAKNLDSRRLVVWHQRGQEIHVHRCNLRPEIDDDDETSNSIMRNL